MKDIKISVIVPIYNTARYLPRCIESICRQTYANLEMVLVDDGSTDESLDICSRYAKEDGRIRVISQKNQGNMAARRAGAAASCGEYLMFVDSDDWIEEELVQILKDAVSFHHADMAVSDVLMVYEDGKVQERRNHIDAGLYTNPKQAVRKLFYYGEDGSDYGILPFIFAKLFRRELIVSVMDHIDDRLQYDEDRAIVWTCLMQDIRVAFLKDMLYHYCIRKAGLVQSKDSMYLVKVNYFYDYMHRLFEREDTVLQNQLDYYLLSSIKDALCWKLGLFKQGILREKYVPDISCLFHETKNIVLYGAGVVGQDYYQFLRESKNIHICAWVDKNYSRYKEKGLDVKDVSAIAQCVYDYILVAVKKEEMFQEIKADLIFAGVPENAVIWGESYRLSDW